MTKGEKILWDALNQIVWGSEDNEAPFRSAPREILIKIAQKAINDYKNLTYKR